MRFEKWHALGNDYVIVEQRSLPFELTPAPDREAVRAAHRDRLRRDPVAVGGRRAGLRRAAADLQPRRLGGRAVGQRRPRGGDLPAPPPRDDRTRSRSRPRPARSARRSPRRRLHGRHGPRAPAEPATIRRGRPTAAASSTADGRDWRSSTSRSATRSARSGSPTAASWRRSTCPRSVRTSSITSCFPNRTNVSWYTRARVAGPDPRTDLRARGGGDVVERNRGHRRRRRLRARRRRLPRHGGARRRRARGRGRGGPARHPQRLGGAGLRGTLADEFIKELHATE